MRERRINRAYDASWIGLVASSQEPYMSPTEYISSRQYILDMVNMTSPIMIVPRLDKVLAKEKRTFYWLAKETGVSHTTLWRLKKGKAVGINFETLEKICRALRCQPGDVLFLTKDKTPPRRQGSKKKS
jgi:putative transcriptional regulator